jgi:Concanavalin A-like lectin/glucanases superfamily
MPSVFTDSANDYDLTITTSSDWNIATGDMPNGDNSAYSSATSLLQNAVWPGEDFCLPATAGADARTFEFWVKVTAGTKDRAVAAIKTNDTAVTAPKRHWQCYLDSSEQIAWSWLTTTGSNYLVVTSSPLAAGWHHVVIVVQCGSTRSASLYIDNVLITSVGPAAGTPSTAASADYQFYLGFDRAFDSEMTDHLAKVAWYERALTTGEINDHYLAMTAS